VRGAGQSSAPEILFIHGARQSRLCWNKQFESPALEGFRKVRFDMRGHGGSDKPTALDAYADLDRWADDVAAVIQAQKLRRPVIVGWSLGGFVTGGFLRKYGSANIAGVNLVDAVINLSPDHLTPLVEKFSETTLSHNLELRTSATAGFLTACFYKQPSQTEMNRLMGINGTAPRAMGEGFMQTKDFDLEPVFKRFPGKILLIHGVHDLLIRVTMSQSLKSQRPDAILSIYDDCGHSPFLENPVGFNQELATFVSSVQRSH
jgi:pimeloyl-ACP methyl ester carboxylesterase